MKKRYLLQSFFITGLTTMSNMNADTPAHEKEAFSNTEVANSTKCSRSHDSCHWKGFEVGADFLWWKFFSDNTGYAKNGPKP